ncbi:MAG: Gfo/Idh/MocA family protein [Halosimplex sp.]
MHEIGLIGSGFIAGLHAGAYADVDDAEIVAVASKEDASEFAERHAPEAALYDDAEALLDERDPDVVDVCVPTDQHRAVVETAVERGHDVLCEKPIARTLADARAMADLVAERDATFMVGHLLRFYPQYRRAKELIADGGVGEPAVANATRVGPYPDYCWDNWFADPERSGGVLLDLSIHDFDYLRWLLGEVERVYTQSARWRDDGSLMDHAVAVLRFESGAVAHVTGSWAQPESRPFGFSLEVAGDEGLVEYDGDGAVSVEWYGDGGDEREAATGVDPMRREIEHFLECVETGETPEITVEDAIEAVRISLAAIESSERGEPVAVAEVGP